MKTLDDAAEEAERYKGGTHEKRLSAVIGASFFFFILGVIFIILASWFKKTELVVLHMDGREIRIPEIKSDSGKKVANMLRTQLYNK